MVKLPIFPFVSFTFILILRVDLAAVSGDHV